MHGDTGLNEKNLLLIGFGKRLIVDLDDLRRFIATDDMDLRYMLIATDHMDLRYMFGSV
jgi:hypothetical protein